MAEKVCAICGRPGTKNNWLNWDHIIPKAHGGPHTSWNLRQVHRKENSARNHTFTGRDLKLAMSRKEAFEAGRQMPDG